MNVDGIAAIVFAVLLAIFLLKKRKKLVFQRALFPLLYVVMYRAKFGIKTMDKLAKRFPRSLKVLGYVGVIFAFIGMVLISVQLLITTVDVFSKPDVAAGIQPVLPIQAEGVFFVPFLYWIISIFLLALVHELAHGIIARVHKIPVKSSGFAFLCVLLPIIPAAFVEPEEQKLKKKSNWAQWSVFAAGPMSNMLFAVVAFGLVLAISPALNAAFDQAGAEVVKVTEDGAAKEAGINAGEVITYINGQHITAIANVSAALESAAPGSQAKIKTDRDEYAVVLKSSPQNESQAHLGVQLAPHLEQNKEFAESYGTLTPPIVKWVSGLLVWLILLNVGIGLFNLLPIGPLDGGRMLHLVCLKFFKEETAMKVFSSVSLFFIVVIIVNLFAGIF